jgi:hypothetical protein
LSMVPAWALGPAALKLIVESFRHPNTDKLLVVNKEQREVDVVPASAERPTRAKTGFAA